MTDRPRLHVGDHVSDREYPEESDTLLVAELHATRAEDYAIDAQRTVADANPEWPCDDKVVSVVYPRRSDMDVFTCKKYAFPRSRLALTEPIHDRDDGGS